MFKTVNNKIMLSDLPYRIGKKLVQVYIPATSSAYFGLAAIWGLPASEQVVGTLAIVATFLGVCLGISAKSYDESGAAHDGNLIVSDGEEGRKLFSLEVDGDPQELAGKSSISFKVKPKE